MYVLILAMWVVPGGSANAIAISSVPGFTSEAACVAAGEQAVKKFDAVAKTVQFSCSKL